MRHKDPKDAAVEFQRLADLIVAEIASRFPVCTASDEFHFFPHVPPAGDRWAQWDDYSADSLDQMAAQCRDWRRKLQAWRRKSVPGIDLADIQLIDRVVLTLHEQLTLLAPHRRQPTYYLTMMGIGLGDAHEAGPQPFHARCQGLPAFVDQAIANLTEVPAIFNQLGQDMIQRMQRWIGSLPAACPGRSDLQAGLSKLAAHLKHLPPAGTGFPPADLYPRIAALHIGCRLTPTQLAYELDCEIAESAAACRHQAARIAPNRPWPEVVRNLRTPRREGGPQRQYDRIIRTLAQHCIDRGLVPASLPRQCPVRVSAIPVFMQPVRSSAAFSAVPGHPARGGTFFIDTIADGTLPNDYRLLAAHETYPGHHLLDARRWDLEPPWRRHIEFPLFYEGWASFSEELLFETGFFDGPADELLMAKRRFWRAIRGRVDFDIHTRRKNPSEAATYLTAHGMDPESARAMVARYRLKPGYQLAYAIGRRHFRRLYDNFEAGNRAADFTRIALSRGEIEFERLESLLMQGESS